MMAKKYYEILGLPDTATKLDVMKKYQELVQLCHPSAPFGSERLFNEVTEAYHLALIELGEKEQEVKSEYVLERVPVTAKLEKALNLKGIRKFIAGVLAGVMVMSALSGCDVKPTEGGDSISGYYLNNTSWLEELGDTSEYFLIKIDDKLHLTMRLLEKNYNKDIQMNRYYDVVSHEYVGMTLCPRCEENCEDLYDYDYFGGEYGEGKLLSAYNIVLLTDFVKSLKPSAEDISFWSSNTEAVHKIYDTFVVNDANLSKRDGVAYDGYDHLSPLKRFECVTKDGKKVTLVGYRASSCETNIGYDYVGNIFDGNYYYIGSNREDAYTCVFEEVVENGHTIAELRSMYGIPFTYANEEGTLDEPAEASVAVSEEPVDSAPMDSEVIESDVVSEPEESEVVDDFDWQANVQKIERYNDVIVLDIRDVELDDILDNKIPSGLNYLFLVPSEDMEPDSHLKAYTDLFDRNALVNFNEGMTYVLYASTDSYFYTNYDADISSHLYTLSDFLRLSGREDMVRDEYTFAEISRIHEEVNPVLSSIEPANHFIVVEAEQVDDTLPKYTVMRLKNYSYYNLENNLQFYTYSEGLQVGNYADAERSIYGLDVQATPLNNFLRENGFESLIDEVGYTDSEALSICEIINGRNIDQETNEKMMN